MSGGQVTIYFPSGDNVKKFLMLFLDLYNESSENQLCWYLFFQ